jgi:hypothetical protein
LSDSSTSLASLSLLDDDTHNGSYTGQNNTLVPQVVDNEGKGRPLPKNASFVSTEMSDEIVLKPQLSKGNLFIQLLCFKCYIECILS